MFLSNVSKRSIQRFCTSSLTGTSFCSFRWSWLLWSGGISPLTFTFCRNVTSRGQSIAPLGASQSATFHTGCTGISSWGWKTWTNTFTSVTWHVLEQNPEFDWRFELEIRKGDLEEITHILMYYHAIWQYVPQVLCQSSFPWAGRTSSCAGITSGSGWLAVEALITHPIPTRITLVLNSIVQELISAIYLRERQGHESRQHIKLGWEIVSRSQIVGNTSGGYVDCRSDQTMNERDNGSGCALYTGSIQLSISCE